MDRIDGHEDSDLPLDDTQAEERGEQARKELDEIPPPGTDPLHEGP